MPPILTPQPTRPEPVFSEDAIDTSVYDLTDPLDRRQLDAEIILRQMVEAKEYEPRNIR
jgi:hypothetical protein